MARVIKPGTILAMFVGLQLVAGCAATKRVAVLSPQPAGDWNTILALEAKDSLEVLLKDGSTLKGRFMRADTESLTIEAGGNRERAIPRQTIDRVEQRMSDSRLNGILLGAGIGFLSGFLGEGLTYHAIGGYDGFPDLVSMGVGLLGAIIGAPTGLVADLLMKKKRIVYRASP